MSDVLVFDVNETLLNVRALALRFEAALGDAGLLPQWFGQMLRNSLVATVTRTYAPFDVQGVDALHLTARRVGVDLSEPDAVALVEAMADLPPHPGVIPALQRFRAAGVRMVTLTNSAPRIVGAQLRNAGLTDYVERSLSVEAVGLFKPALRSTATPRPNWASTSAKCVWWRLTIGTSRGPFAPAPRPPSWHDPARSWASCPNVPTSSVRISARSRISCSPRIDAYGVRRAEFERRAAGARPTSCGQAGDPRSPIPWL